VEKLAATFWETGSWNGVLLWPCGRPTAESALFFPRNGGVFPLGKGLPISKNKKNFTYN
jgi:hypothetical protein